MSDVSVLNQSTTESVYRMVRVIENKQYQYQQEVNYWKFLGTRQAKKYINGNEESFNMKINGESKPHI